MKITKYIVVQSSSISALTTEVNKLIEIGLQPIGGISYAGDYHQAYVQSMVKYEEPK